MRISIHHYDNCQANTYLGSRNDHNKENKYLRTCRHLAAKGIYPGHVHF